MASIDTRVDGSTDWLTARRISVVLHILYSTGNERRLSIPRWMIPAGDFRQPSGEEKRGNDLTQGTNEGENMFLTSVDPNLEGSSQMRTDQFRPTPKPVHQGMRFSRRA